MGWYSGRLTPAANVAIVTTYFAPVLGGAETAAAQLAEFLAAQGRKVSVFTKRTDPAHPAHDIVGGVEIFRLPPIGPRSASGKWTWLVGLRRALLDRRASFDAIVCIDYRAVGLAALSARRSLNCAVVLQAATDGVLGDGALGRLATWPVRVAYRSADAYPCISRQIESETLAAGVPRERVFYIPNPVDAARFNRSTSGARTTLRARMGIPSNAVVAVFLGRLSREKGGVDLLQAWPFVRQALPSAHLLIVGPDMPGHPWDVGAAMRQMAASPALQGSVHFAGGVPPEDVPDWLSAGDVAVQPSHFEAFGTSAIEAMAAGLPVVATNVGGLPDFVTPATGVLVAPQAPRSLAAAITPLLADDVSRAKLSAGARAAAAAFDIPVVLGRFAAVIDDAAARRRVQEKTA